MPKVKFLAFSCPHCPLHDPNAVERMLETIRSFKPDIIVHLGDGHEAAAASRFVSEYQHHLRDEYITHNEFLRSIRLARPRARRVFLFGNHDDNLIAPTRIPEELRDLVDFRRYEPELKRWELPHDRYEFHRERGTLRVGPVTFAHGFHSGVTADRLHAVKLGRPYGLYVGGHTHRPLAPTQAVLNQSTPLPYWYCNAGCLRDLHPEYALRIDNAMWGNGVVVGETTTNDKIVERIDWEAQTIIFKMA